MTAESAATGKTVERWSLDAWAAIVALLLALIVRMGIFKTVPW